MRTCSTILQVLKAPVRTRVQGWARVLWYSRSHMNEEFVNVSCAGGRICYVNDLSLFRTGIRGGDVCSQNLSENLVGSCCIWLGFA
jgi:hypothetical protein